MNIYLTKATCVFMAAFLYIVGTHVKWNKMPGIKKETRYTPLYRRVLLTLSHPRHAIKRTRRPFRCQLRIPLSSLTFNQRDYVGLHFCPVYFREAISLRLVQNGSITQGYRCGCAMREMEYCHYAKFDLQSAFCRRILPCGSYNWRGIQ